MNVALSRPEGAVLLVIDLQLGMFNGQRIAPIHAGEMLLAQTRAVLAHARRLGVRVIYVRHAGPEGHILELGTPNWQIHPSITPQDGDEIIDKRTPDSFHETSLTAALTSEGIRRLAIVGAQTEVCVDTTCRRAFSLGFEVALISDAHSTWDNDALTADQIIRHTNKTLAGWFVRLVPASEVSNWFQKC
jgi:nicotinamidase-related amidase